MRCPSKAHWRYTWPGKNERLACTEHAALAEAIAKGLGIHLQFIPLPDTTEEQCQHELAP